MTNLYLINLIQHFSNKIHRIQNLRSFGQRLLGESHSPLILRTVFLCRRFILLYAAKSLLMHITYIPLIFINYKMIVTSFFARVAYYY
jgi:hypothetical protein